MLYNNSINEGLSMNNSNKAFTMLELVFVIAVIGILSAIALPKFAASRNDAVIAKAKSTVAGVRMGITTARQQMVLQGQFAPITSLSSSTGYDNFIFDGVNGVTSNPILEYPIRACRDASSTGCWYTANNIDYRYNMPITGFVDFNITNNKFTCKIPNDPNCRLLTE